MSIYSDFNRNVYKLAREETGSPPITVAKCFIDQWHVSTKDGTLNEVIEGQEDAWAAKTAGVYLWADYNSVDWQLKER